MERRDFSQPVRRDSPYYTVAEQAEPKKSTADLAAEIHRIQKQQRNKFFKKVALTLLVIGIVCLGAYWINNKITQNRLARNIPLEIRQGAPFPLYFPGELPSGYTINTKMETIENDVFFLQLENGNSRIIISEQSMPRSAATISLGDQVSVDTPVGPAIVGTANNIPVAILKTEKTLVNVSGSKDTTQESLLKLVRSMRAVSP